MAPRLGGMFATGALGPVYYAGQCILARRVEEGLRELNVENLRGGVERGVLQASQRVSVPPAEIEHLLPMRDLDAILMRLASSQPAVMEAWKLYAGGLGGLLAGVADLTVDGRAPDTALAVQRLAKKVQRDKGLSEPLARLADDLFDWQDALHRCVEMLNDTKALQAAYERIEAEIRLKRRMRIALLCSLGVVVASVLLAVAWVRVARAKVLAVIEKPDACAAMDLTDADLDRVSDELKARAKDNRAKCEAARAAEAKQKEEARQREEKELEAKKAQEALEASCDALAADIAAGKLSPEDEAFAKASSPFLSRIARGTLDLADYGPDEPAMPCKGTKAEPKLAAALRKAVVAKPWNIPKAETLSAAVREAIVVGAADLPDKLKKMMGTRAADAAKKAIASGKPDQIARAISFCDTAKAMGTAPQGPCDGVKSLPK